MTDTSLSDRSIRKPSSRGSTDRSGARASSQVQGMANQEKPSWLIPIFIFAMFTPNLFFIAGLRLSAYKIILLVMFIPVFYKWISVRTGGVKGVDFLIIGYAVWAYLGLFVLHGFQYMEIGGILFVESLTPFLLARVYIRTPQDFEFFIKSLCWAIVLMLPFAIFESMTGRMLMSEILGKITPVHPDLQHEMRLYMHRAQGPFEHPILFGVFTATAFSSAFLIWGYGMSGMARTLRGLGVGLVTFFSLSMGAYVALMIQVALLMWNWILRKVKGRWTILLSIFFVLYVIIDILSNRTPIEVFITTLTFRGGASYNRLLIWEYGSAEALRHPIFGIGFNDWQRLPWMVPSVDNFWLLTAMKSGLPAFLMLIGAFISSIYKTASLDLSNDPKMASYRLAYIFGLIGFMLSLCTVHVWNATYVFLIFFLGSCVWMRDYTAENAAPLEEGDAPQQGRRRSPKRSERTTSKQRSRAGTPERSRAATPERGTAATKPEEGQDPQKGPSQRNRYTRGPTGPSRGNRR